MSLQELFLVAQDCVTGSDEYNEVFEIAVRMFPNDETANLNAANTAMGMEDLKNALRTVLSGLTAGAGRHRQQHLGIHIKRIFFLYTFQRCRTTARRYRYDDGCYHPNDVVRLL